ncbi:MAG: MmgE/PrpD family protein [Desulfovermiculus sp.]|nr:MmgE/PrpD family protein [Desulfovermiculus sp.]
MTLTSFIHNLTWDDLPDRIKNQARRCLLDTLGVAMSGSQTELSRIIYRHVRDVYAGQGSRLWLDGNVVSKPGAALAHGMTIDSLDMHDGHPLTKGHAGAAVVPALFAALPDNGPTGISGREFLTSLVVGYEVALRAGISLHATSPDFHSSGAWNALGCAAVCARRFGLSREQTRHALGFAEYNGPRSQMMRCVEHPTMIKDGSGWGSMTGVSAAVLARSGFTGAPALTVEDEAVREIWCTLGQTWEMDNQYFKPQAICRWAQPAVEGVLQLQAKHCISPKEVSKVVVKTFEHGVRLAGRAPETTEQAQYSLIYPLAAAMFSGRLGFPDLCGEVLQDSQICELASKVLVEEDLGFSSCFPEQRWARVQVTMFDGQVFDSGPVQARWDAHQPPTNLELLEKFRILSREVVSETRADKVEDELLKVGVSQDVHQLRDVLLQS